MSGAKGARRPSSGKQRFRGQAVLFVVGIAAGLGGAYLFHRSGADETEAGRSPTLESSGFPASPVSPEAAPGLQEKVEPSTTEASEDVIVLGVARSLDSLNAAGSGPEEDLIKLQVVFDAYRRIDGSNPEGGLNSEIVETLTGKNTRKVALISPDHPALNEDGELVDRWGTPYWFHKVSAQRMDVVSAGPDRQLFTDDDVTLE